MSAAPANVTVTFSALTQEDAFGIIELLRAQPMSRVEGLVAYLRQQFAACVNPPPVPEAPSLTYEQQVDQAAHTAEELRTAYYDAVQRLAELQTARPPTPEEAFDRRVKELAEAGAALGRSVEVSVGGLVDHTMAKRGEEFYRAFINSGIGIERISVRDIYKAQEAPAVVQSGESRNDVATAMPSPAGHTAQTVTLPTSAAVGTVTGAVRSPAESTAMGVGGSAVATPESAPSPMNNEDGA